MSVLFAATYPERTRALVLYGTYAKRLRGDDYPWAPTWEERVAVARRARARLGRERRHLDNDPRAPTPRCRAWFERRGRAPLSPAAARDLILMNSKIDVRDVLPAVQCPTLVLHRAGDRDSSIEEGRYIAEHIPGARSSSCPATTTSPGSTPDQSSDEIEEFLTGVRPRRSRDRVLATVLFTDIVGSTERARELGDAHGVSCSTGTTPLVRRELARFAGVEVDDDRRWLPRLVRRPGAGDPLRARDPRRAAAARARDPGGRAHGRGRAAGDDVGGIAVHIAARVAALAGPGEVLVSQTTARSRRGSGLEFEDRGEHELKGISGARRLYAVR